MESLSDVNMMHAVMRSSETLGAWNRPREFPLVTDLANTH